MEWLEGALVKFFNPTIFLYSRYRYCYSYYGQLRRTPGSLGFSPARTPVGRTQKARLPLRQRPGSFQTLRHPPPGLAPQPHALTSRIGGQALIITTPVRDRREL